MHVPFSVSAMFSHIFEASISLMCRRAHTSGEVNELQLLKVLS